MEFFNALGILAVVTGGVLSAFSARRPSRFAMWVTAYLVLVVGVVQVGLALGWWLLELPNSLLAAAAFLLFNVGNGLVIAGRFVKGRKAWARFVVYAGGACLAVSMCTLGGMSLQAPMSWTLASFLALVLIILVSMPVGLVLSSRPHKN